MFCFMARKLISQEMDGVLPARKTRALEEHVDRCAACRAFRTELETGRRLLRATATEPSEAFEWTLQLKLNRAMQSAAASGAVPWVESQGGSAFAWLRSFGLSSVAGLALAAVLAVWVLPLGTGPLPASGDLHLAETAGETAASPVTLSAGDADRLSLSPQPRYRPLLSGSSGSGRTVSGWSLAQPNLLDRSGWVPTTWRGAQLEGNEAFAAVREENGRLRFMLRQLRAENDALKSLLEGTEINYLETEADEESP